MAGSYGGVAFFMITNAEIAKETGDMAGVGMAAFFLDVTEELLRFSDFEIYFMAS